MTFPIGALVAARGRDWVVLPDSDDELLLPSTVRRLENQCQFGESLYQRFPFLVISIDFIKSERYRHDFLRHTGKASRGWKTSKRVWWIWSHRCGA